MVIRIEATMSYTSLRLYLSIGGVKVFGINPKEVLVQMWKYNWCIVYSSHRLHFHVRCTEISMLKGKIKI